MGICHARKDYIVERRAEKQRVERRLDDLWRQMRLALGRGEWDTYFALRRSWLSLGRLHSFLIQEEAKEASAQLTLLESKVGRAHNREAS